LPRCCDFANLIVEMLRLEAVADGRFPPSDLSFDEGSLIITGALLPSRSAKRGDVINVTVALRIVAWNSAPRRRDDNLDVRAELDQQTRRNALSVVGAVGQKTVHVGVGV